MEVFNLWDGLPVNSPVEQFTPLFSTPALRVERIFSQGHASPPDVWYDQPQAEWILLLQGAARLQFEDRCVDLCRGDSLHIPSHVRHRVDWTTPDEPTLWLAIHHPPES